MFFNGGTGVTQGERLRYARAFRAEILKDRDQAEVDNMTKVTFGEFFPVCKTVPWKEGIVFNQSRYEPPQWEDLPTT